MRKLVGIVNMGWTLRAKSEGWRDALLFPYLDGSLDAPTTAKVGVAKNARAAASPVLAAIVDKMARAGW